MHIPLTSLRLLLLVNGLLLLVNDRLLHQGQKTLLFILTGIPNLHFNKILFINYFENIEFAEDLVQSFFTHFDYQLEDF